jgi:periplasmic protein TonB
MNSAARFGISLLLASAVALGLFWLMTSMIARDDAGLLEKQQLPMLNFIRMDDPTTQIRRRERERPEPPEQPEPIPRPEAMAVPEQQIAQPQLQMDLPDFHPNLALAGVPVMAAPGPTGPVAYTQPLTPVSQVPPMYPRRAMLDKISGWVRLEFIINEDGTVRDIQVVEADPRRGIFDHEASRALSRWKFHPQTVDGKPVPARATITINFKLDR